MNSQAASSTTRPNAFSRMGHSVRNLFRNPQTPDRPAAGVWDSVRNLHTNTTSVFNPLHKKVENLTNRVGNRVGRPVGKLLYIIYKIAPLTIFLLCTPTWVVASVYTATFLTIRFAKLIHPNDYDKYASQYARPASVGARYFAIYAAIRAVVSAVGIVFKTEPHMNLIMTALFAIAAVDLIKLYREMDRRVQANAAASSANMGVSVAPQGTGSLQVSQAASAVLVTPPSTMSTPVQSSAGATISSTVSSPSPLPPPDPVTRKKLFAQSPRQTPQKPALPEDSSEEDEDNVTIRKREVTFKDERDEDADDVSLSQSSGSNSRTESPVGMDSDDEGSPQRPRKPTRNLI